MAHISIHQFAEKTVLITDTVDVFGRGAAMQMALQGGFIIGGSKDEKKNTLIEELKEFGTLATAVSGRSTKIVDEAYFIFGRIDLLVNIIDSDLNESLEILKACADKMLERPKARIVNMIYVETADFANNIHSKIIDATKNVDQKIAINNIFLNFKADRSLSTTTDDAARVVLFLLSSEAKALDRQMITLY